MKNLIQNIGTWSSQHPKKALLTGLLITIAAVVGSLFLQLEMNFYSIMPQNTQATKDLGTIVEDFPASDSLLIYLEAPDQKSLEESALAIQTRLGQKDMQALVKQVVLGPDREFLRDYALLLEDLDMETMDPSALTRTIQEIDIDTLSVPEAAHIRHAVAALATDFQNFTQRGNQSSTLPALQSAILGPRLLSNETGTRGIITVLTHFGVNDFFTLATGVEQIEEAVTESLAPFNTQQVKAGFTGFLVVAKDEAVTSEQGLALGFVVALVLISLLMIINFRMPQSPLLLGFPLLIGIFWTIGFAGFALGRLNILTAMYIIALMGLGIDFGIHILTAYLQSPKETGPSPARMHQALGGIGRGLLTGGLTTSAAFFSLMAAESHMAVELGIIAGAGIILELLAMTLLVPALVSSRANRLEKRGKPEFSLPPVGFISGHQPGRLPQFLTRHSGKLALITGALAVILFTFAPNISLEDNIMNLEAEGLESIELQERMVNEMGIAPDPLYILSGSLEETRRLHPQLTKIPGIQAVDSIAALLPSQEDITRRKSAIQDLLTDQQTTPPSPGQIITMLRQTADLKEALQSLISATIDDPQPYLTNLEGDQGTQKLLAYLAQLETALSQWMEASLQAPELTFNRLPEDITRLYFSKDGTQNLITLYPKGNLWESEPRNELLQALEPVAPQATSMVLASDQMVTMVSKDGLRASIIALVVIFILLFIDFRDIRYTLATLAPLVLSIGSLLGIMALTEIKIDFMNFIAIPLLIGIGIDDAVHLSHARRDTMGRGTEPTQIMPLVLSRIGKAILMTTITTVIGFLSFIPSPMRGMRGVGIVLSLAVVLALFYSIFFHSGVLKRLPSA